MKPKLAKLMKLVRKVDLIEDQLKKTCIGQREPILRVEDLHYVIEQAYGLKIEKHLVDFQAVHLKGCVVRYTDKSATIYVRADLSPAEQRLVAVKELCHLFLDEEDDWSTDGVATIDEYIEEEVAVSANGVGLQDPGGPLHSEIMAMLASTMLLYPEEYRDSDLQKLDADEATYASIALEHGIPPYAISHAFKNRELLLDVRKIIAAARD